MQLGYRSNGASPFYGRRCELDPVEQERLIVAKVLTQRALKTTANDTGGKFQVKEFSLKVLNWNF